MTLAINEFFERIGSIFQSDAKPASDSQAFQEEKTFKDPELLRDAYYRGVQSVESAADHLVAFADLLTPLAKTVAPWTCARGALESCALGAWLLDPKANARERVARCYAFRYEGYVQQIKQAQAQNNELEMQRASNRMKEVAAKSIQLGFPKFTGKRSEVGGIGQRWPGITELVRITLDKEADYRFMSAVAHGHHWATLITSFRVVEKETAPGVREKGLEKYVHPDFMYYLGNVTVTSLSQVLWSLWITYGWNLDELQTLLDETYGRLKYSQRSRFWRNSKDKA